MINNKICMATIAMMMLFNRDYQKQAKAATLPSADINITSNFEVGPEIQFFIPESTTQCTELVEKNLVLPYQMADLERIGTLLETFKNQPMPCSVRTENERFFVSDVTTIFTTVFELTEFYLGADQLNQMITTITTANRTNTKEINVMGLNIQGMKLDLGATGNQNLTPEETRRMLLYGHPMPQQTITFDEDSSLWYIARDFGLTEEEIYLLNPQIKGLKWGELLGQVIDVTPIDPLVKIEAEIKETYPSTIPFEIEYLEDETLLEGHMEIVQSGKEGELLTQITTQFDGTTIIEEEVAVEAVKEIVLYGTRVVTGVGTGEWVWPTMNKEIVNGYLSSEGHYGIDIKSIAGQSVLAADHGIVESIEQEGESCTVLINHTNGYYSRYGNLNQVIVSKGDIVNSLQQIATTDKDSVYFEIRTNNGELKTYAPNPLDFF